METMKFIAWPDTHLPEEDEKAVRCALEICKWYQPEEIIILGDFMDMGSISHHNRTNLKEREGLRLKRDFDLANALLDDIQETCERIIYIQGNHDGSWVENAIATNPELDGLINLEENLYFKERKIKTFKYNECYKLGHLYFTHGTYTGPSHARKHVEAYGRSIAYGHLHDVQIHVKVSPLDVNDRHMGISLGCLAKKNPQYMKNKPNNWVHAIGVGQIFPNGNFSIHPIIINEGVAAYGGETFEWKANANKNHKKRNRKTKKANALPLSTRKTRAVAWNH